MMTRLKKGAGGARRSIRKFNPGTFQSDEELIDQFVVRSSELGLVLEVLRGNIDSPSHQHILVVAPRGRGKTMLLARVAAEIRTHSALGKELLPVRFMEESPEIFNLADFWLEALFHLAREISSLDPKLSRELRQTHAALCGRWQDPALDRHARAAVLSAADLLERKLVLMVENLESLAENVDSDFGWQLREALQSDPQIMLLASATGRFAGLDDAGQPFFELFRVVELKQLSTEECRQLWHMATGESVLGRQVRPLEILTGGSPRLLMIVAGFARQRSLRELMEELVALADEHTEYFRGHLEALPKTERRVYISVIDLWKPSTASEIAARSRIDIRVASTMLGRLVARGAVTPRTRGRKRLYVATERLYSIYYKLRHERDEAAVVRNLIHFMAVFYSETELSEISDVLSLEAAEWPTILEGIQRAILDPPSDDETPSKALHLFKLVSERAADGYHREIERQLTVAFREGAFQRIVEIADRAFESKRIDPSQARKGKAEVLYLQAFAYARLNKPEAAIASYGEVVDWLSDRDEPDLRWIVALSLHASGDAREELGDFKGAIASYDEVVARFGGSDERNLRWAVATSIDARGEVRGKLGDFERATADYDEVVARFGGSDEPNLRWVVAGSIRARGEVQAELGDFERAVADYDEVVARFGDSGEPDLRWVVAGSIRARGGARERLGDFERAVAAYDEVVARFGDSDDPDLWWRIAAALRDRGGARGELGDFERAITDYDEVVARFGDSDGPFLRWVLAASLRDRGIARGKLGDFEGATADYDEVIARFGAAEEPSVHWWVASALTTKAATQAANGLSEKALETCNELETRLGAKILRDIDTQFFTWQLMRVRTKVFLAHKGRHAAMEAFRSAYAAFPPDDQSRMKELLILVADLIRSGASSQDLVEILSSDSAKSSKLLPLLVALRKHGGEEVSVPEEIQEVASDVRKGFQAIR